MAALEGARDPLLAELAGRFRNRRLFKTMRLRKDLQIQEAEGRLRESLRRAGAPHPELGVIDRVEVEAFSPKDSLEVLIGGEALDLLQLSPVMRGLSREAFVHCRAVFPGEYRDEVTRDLADLQ